MLRSKNKPTTQMKGLTLCLSGVELLQKENLKPYFIEIKNLVSCPDDIYRELYLATLYRLAEFCQAMSFSESDFNGSYGFLERQLKLVIAALKLRRGSLFPKNAGTERISAEEAQWTYALFSGSLLKDLYTLGGSRAIQLYESNGKENGLWLPVLGSLREQAVYYRMDFSANQAAARNDILMTFFAGKILPSVSLQWLVKNTDLFNQWWDVIIHKSSQENSLEMIIQEAARKATIIISEISPTNNVSSPAPAMDYRSEFTRYIMEQVEKNPERIFRISNGLFVNMEVIDNFLVENNIHSKITFMQCLEKENWLIITERECSHKLSPKRFDDRRTLQGIIVNIDFVPEKLQKLTLNEYFQKPIPL